MTRHATLKLMNGPLAGDQLRGDLNQWGRPPWRIYPPVPVLDEDAETFEWRTGLYFLLVGKPRRSADEPYGYWFSDVLSEDG